MTTVTLKAQNAAISDAVQDALGRAERLHPVFADGIYQGVGRIGEEYGELCQAVNHGEGEERIMAEAWDLLTVAWRFVRGDWRAADAAPEAPDAPEAPEYMDAAAAAFLADCLAAARIRPPLRKCSRCAGEDADQCARCWLRLAQEKAGELAAERASG